MSRKSRCKLVYGYAVPVLHRSYYAVNRYSQVENNELETIQRRSFPFGSEESEVEVDVCRDLSVAEDARRPRPAEDEEDPRTARAR